MSKLALFNRRTSAPNRSGVAVLELILVLPILVLTLIAAIQFSSVLTVDTTLKHASIEASRLASLGCDSNQIESRIDEFLSVHNMSISGGGVRVVIEDENGIAQSSGDGSLTSTTIGGPVTAGTVRSTLLVETDAQPIPNLLRDYCVDFSGQQSEHTSVAIQQTADCP